jgi:hypothetical protein
MSAAPAPGRRKPFEPASATLHPARQTVEDNIAPRGPVPPNGTCQWCGAQIRWVGHPRTGERRPVDLQPELTRPAVLNPKHRNVVLIDLDSFIHEEEAEGRAGPLSYRPHHVGCPELPSRVRQRDGHTARQQMYVDARRSREDNLARSGALPLYEPEPEPAKRLTAEERQAIRARVEAARKASRQGGGEG